MFSDHSTVTAIRPPSLQAFIILLNMACASSSQELATPRPLCLQSDGAVCGHDIKDSEALDPGAGRPCSPEDAPWRMGRLDVHLPVYDV